MASFFKKLTKAASTISTIKSVTNSVSTGNFGSLANTAISIASNQNNITQQINSISGFGKVASQFASTAGKSSLFGQDFTGGTFGFPQNRGNFNFGTILGGALELEGLVNSPIRIIPKSAAEIFNLEGGRFDFLRQAASDLSELSAYSDFVDDSFYDPRDPVKKSGASKSRIENPLRNFSSYNYKFTMGILSAKEFNNPNLYREADGFQNYIIKSTGGQLEKRYQVLDEVERSPVGHGEYFIEDFNYEGLVAPNPATGVTTGMLIQFKVIEPFSMGNFTEAIVGASASLGYKNYFSAPFCVRLDFSGWGEEQEQLKLKPIFLPLKINQMDMRVTGQGCEYDVSAVPFTDLGLADNINKIMTNVNAPGNIVHEILQTGEDSLSNNLNKRIEVLEESNIIPGYDRYLICFPKNRDSILKYLETGRQKVEETTALQEEVTKQGLASEEEIDQELLFNQQSVTDKKKIEPSSQMFETLLAYASDETNMNEIGLSAIVKDDAEGGDAPMATFNGSYSGAGAEPERAKLIRKDAAVAQQPTKGRITQFSQGESIISAIEKTLLNSEYCKENAVKESDSKGVKRWFRIDPYVYLEENKTTEEKVGRPPAVFIYCVYPYETDEAKFLGPKQIPKNTAGLRQSAAKEYNYTYTGNNEDVLRFDIEFNTAFMKTALAGYGNNSGAMQAEASQSKVISDSSPKGAKLAETPPEATDAVEQSAGTQEVTRSESNNATRSLDIRRQVAEQFHDSITNQITDMISVEMDIWGDPFFMPQEIGNYAPKQSGASPNATEDGTMTYTKGEVFVVVNFRTPFDYQVDGALMDQPVIVPQFSGLFSVWKTTSTFSNGQFTQTLNLIRRYGQSQESTPNNKGLIQIEEDAKMKETLPNSSKVDDSQKLGSTTPSETQTAVNQASNLITQIENSGSSVVGDVTGAIANQAQISQGIVANLTSSGSVASQAISNLTSSGAVASQALSKFTVPTTANLSVDNFGFNKFKTSDIIGDTSQLVNDALVNAIPSFGQVSVDLSTPQGQLGVLTNTINKGFDDILGTKPSPAIVDATEELKGLATSVASIDLGPSINPESITKDQTQALLKIAQAKRMRGTVT